MVDEPNDEKPLQSEKSATDSSRTNLGYTTQEALKVLCDEIETLVTSYETKFHNERSVLHINTKLSQQQHQEDQQSNK